jgi:hypothetical protein
LSIPEPHQNLSSQNIGKVNEKNVKNQTHKVRTQNIFYHRYLDRHTFIEHTYFNTYGTSEVNLIYFSATFLKHCVKIRERFSSYDFCLTSFSH